jgi:serine/threonine protein kinase
MSWSPGDLRLIISQAKRCEFRLGDVLFRQGQSGDEVFLIRRGLVEIYTESCGVRRRLNLRGRGEIIGEMALLDGEGRSASAIARTHVVARSLGRDAWDNLLMSQPQLIRGLSRQLSQRLRQLQSTLGTELDRREQAASRPLLNSIGPFRLEERIAEGGMGVIYKGRHQFTGQPRAVKVLPIPTEEQKLRFSRECETMARLIHPNIVRIDSGGLEGYYAYVSMELLEGETLERRLVRGPLRESEVRRWFMPAVEALACAQRQGICHRDVKPDNLFMTLDGTLKVLDFGIARRVSGPQLTVDGRFFGTPQYLAPERIGGSAQSHERQSDQYSLGVTLYRALTGQCPFEYDDVAEVLAAHLHHEPIPPSRWAAVSAPLEKCIMRLLAKDPLRRYTDFEELSKALEQALPQFTTPTPTLDLTLLPRLDRPHSDG